MTNNTKKIALVAIFVAMGIVLNIFSSQFPRIDVFGRMSLVYAFCFLAGALLGPWLGFSAAAIADLIPAFILPEGGQVWMPLITLSNGLMAFTCGAIFKWVKWKSMILKLILAAVSSFVICTLGFTALGETILYLYFGSAPFYPSVTVLVNSGMGVYPAFVLRKLITQPFWVAGNVVLAYAVLKSSVLVRYYKKSKAV